LTEKQFKYDTLYMNIANSFAKMSFAERKKVGAIAVKNGNIIGHGWNGMPSGWTNVCEIDNVTKPEVLHAEMNLISKLAKGTESSEGATVYVTLSPCIECAKLMLQAGIKRVVYQEQYRDKIGIDFLMTSGVEVYEKSLETDSNV
jgi:dCMP deaminase